MFVNKLFIHISLMQYPDNCPPRKITPLPPPVRVGVSVNSRVIFRVGGQPDNCPGEKLPLVRVRVWVRISFGIGGQFSSGPIVLEPSHGHISKTKRCLKGMLRPIFCTDINTHSDRK